MAIPTLQSTKKESPRTRGSSAGGLVRTATTCRGTGAKAKVDVNFDKFISMVGAGNFQLGNKGRRFTPQSKRESPPP
jgi:hypothetical protein